MANFTRQYNFSPKGFNPLFWHVLQALLDPSIRFIKVEGGSSAAKTYSICQALLIAGFQHEYSTMVFRAQLVDILDSVYSTFKMAKDGMELDYYIPQQNLFKGKDGKSDIRFRGLDDDENIKGIAKFNFIYFNEWNQCEEYVWDQAKLRLRGLPNQKFICDWNPVSSKLWQYENDIDTQEWTDLPLSIEGREFSGLDPEYSFKRTNKAKDTIWIKVTYRDNYWVVGRPWGGGNIDTHALENFEVLRLKKPNLYRIYANGERGIIRTGGEFWKQFDEVKHVRKIEVAPTTIHLSCDQNANPYVTVGAWQYVNKNIRQINEFPCRNPDNNAIKAAKRVIKWLDSIDYKDVLYVYGDPSGNSQNTIDENNLSWYDKFISTLQEAGYSVFRRIGKSHPEVARSAEFVNDIYENEYDGYSITIGDNCPVSIDDYISVKEDKDGAMLKTKVKDKVTGQTYEPFGHFSDAKRYFICKILEKEFTAYKTRKSNVWMV